MTEATILGPNFFTEHYHDLTKVRVAAGLGRTCAKCRSWWTGDRTCHCPSCHYTFTTPWAFDLHRVGGDDSRRCLDPATLTDRDRALTLAERGGILAWSRPMDDAERDRLKRLRRQDDEDADD